VLKSMTTEPAACCEEAAFAEDRRLTSLDDGTQRHTTLFFAPGPPTIS